MGISQMYETFRSVVRFRELELDPVARRLSKIADVADYRAVAKRRLPGGVFDYIDGGAEDERTLAQRRRLRWLRVPATCLT